jgi:hypothetical protein
VRNPIYKQIFDLAWVKRQLAEMRPYSPMLKGWLESGKTDDSRLLGGESLKEAQLWTQGKSLSDLDYQFLATSEECDRARVQQALEAEKTQAIANQMKAVEQQLAEEQKRREQEHKNAQLQRNLFRVASIAFAVVVGLGLIAFWQYHRAEHSLKTALQREREARISEIKALVSSSQGSFDSNNRLDALVAAIKATRSLQKVERSIPSETPELSELSANVQEVLQRSQPWGGYWIL